MTNEQKASQLVKQCSITAPFQSLYELVLQMATWKDSQYEQRIIDKDCEIERLELIIEELKKGGKK